MRPNRPARWLVHRICAPPPRSRRERVHL